MPVVMEPSWVGRRVSVRRVLSRTAEGRPQFSDVVGDLLSLSADTAVVHSRHGLVEVALSEVALARIAPPSTAEELALEDVAARGWRAAETEQLGGWLLRASDGFTGRANSVLPLGRPDVPLDDALERAHDWYAARELPAQFQLPVAARRLLDAELGEKGWTASPPVDVLAARVDQLLAAGSGRGHTPEVHITDRPDDAWLARYRDGGGTATAARGILTRHERVGFASVRIDGEVVAIGRATVDRENTPAGTGSLWLGITAVEVAPESRRRGLARAIMHALGRWGAERGASRSHLEVSADNDPARELYRTLGYWQHHAYHYRREPGARR
jgi:ribosomal protein S18 acetylase RimI-like enzyme